MTSHQLLVEWARWFWPVFANHLWQATLFAFAVWIAVKFFNRAPARFRYFLWMGALAKFLIPSAMLVWLIGQAGVDLSLPFKAVRSAASTAASGIATAYTETRMIFHTAEPVSPVERPVMTNAVTTATAADYQAEFYYALTILWLLGASAFTVRWLIRRRCFARSLCGARIITSGREFDAFKRARSWLFVNRDVGLVVSSQIREPGVWRVWRPVIVLPEGVAGRLSDEEIEAVMMHELVHVMHRDNLIGTLQVIVCSLLWFHPLAWLIDRRLLAEREMWCDETVIRLGGQRELYAASLWKVVQIGLGWPVAGVSRAAGSDLKRRLERMLTSNDQMEMTVARRAAAYASFFVLAFLYIAVGLSGDSAFAQRNKIEATNKKELGGEVKGGVESGIPRGVPGGIIGNGVVGGVSVGGGVSDGISNEESQRSNKWELIKQAPEFLMKVENRDDSPLQITDARVRIMEWEFKKETAPSAHGNSQLEITADSSSYQRDQKQVTFTGNVIVKGIDGLEIKTASIPKVIVNSIGGPEVKTDSLTYENQAPKDPKSAGVIIAQFDITLVNRTDRRITGVILEYQNPGLKGRKFQIGPPILPNNSPIEPHGSYVIGKDMLHHHLRVGGGAPGAAADAIDDPTLFSISVAGVRFENEPSFQQLSGSKRHSAPFDRDLYEAAESGDISNINESLNAGANVNCALDGDGSPLIGAARKGHLAAVRLLLDRGADPNMPVSGDGNPLIMAAREGHADVVSLLLDRGANIDQMVPGDENALIQASGRGHLRVVKLLVSRGADVNARTLVEGLNGLSELRSELRSPLSMARKGGHQAVVAFLLAAGARE
ncbi:MAG TPA: M56 family metallopeptidase [Blastocatellia bacterium]|nr:M56 family metallopeptidase [Blastocatellia bacterium]